MYWNKKSNCLDETNPLSFCTIYWYNNTYCAREDVFRKYLFITITHINFDLIILSNSHYILMIDDWNMENKFECAESIDIYTAISHTVI